MNLGKPHSPLHCSPARLLDALLQHLKLNNDGALSRRLHVAGHVIHAIRNGKMPIGASMLLWMQEVSGLSVHELRHLLGDRRARCRPVHIIRSRIPHR